MAINEPRLDSTNGVIKQIYIFLFDVTIPIRAFRFVLFLFTKKEACKHMKITSEMIARPKIVGIYSCASRLVVNCSVFSSLDCHGFRNLSSQK